MFKLRSLMLVAAIGTLPACKRPESATQPDQQAAVAQPATPPSPLQLSQHTVTRGSSLYQSLRNVGIDSSTIIEWVKCSKRIFPLEEIAADTPFTISWSREIPSKPVRLEMAYALDSSLIIERDETDLEWTASKLSFPVRTETRTYSSVVTTSLWESAEIVGMDPSLITSLAEVFAWQIDFNHQVRKGDRWRLTVEQKMIGDRVIGWGNIIVAEYENNGQRFTGIRFPQEGEPASYYSPDGQSLRRMFLKSPLKYGRITSAFSHARFHPILKESRPHNGVDYGAPVGTPVMAVGRGQVQFIGANGGSGNMIKIRHNGSYATAYLHLKGYAAGLRKGSSVEQGQVIGYVGATGLATGPHLHFSFYENGRYVDPSGMKFPSAEPLPSQQLPGFQMLVAEMMQTLPDWQVAKQEAPAGFPKLPLNGFLERNEDKLLVR